MSKIKREFKSVLAIALTIMLVLSMMMGVFTLSASADGSNQFPVVLNKPVLVYRDDWNGYGYLSNTLTTISVRLDDSLSNCGLSNITNVKYNYTDEEGGISKNSGARWYLANKFGVLLVNVSDIWEYYFPNSSNNNLSGKTRKEYVEFLNGLGRSSLSLDVYFNNSSEPMHIDVGVVDEKLVQSTYSTAWETSGSILIRLAHCKLLENEDFYELDNAIVGVQSANMDTTNKYYVDIDSEDDVKIPMNEMSDTVELVQTRVGNNVVYNSYGSVDFGGSSVAALSNGVADVGTAFYMPNGAYASCDDPWELVRYMGKNGYFYPMGELDNQPISMRGFYVSYYMNWSSSIYQEKFGDLVDHGYVYTDYYQGLTYDVDNEMLNKYARLVLFSLNGANNDYKFGMDFNEEAYLRYMNSTRSSGDVLNGMWDYISPSPFVLSFDGNNEKSVEFLNNLHSYINSNSSSPLAMYLNGKDYYNGRESGSVGKNETYVNGSQRFFRIAYSYKDTNGNSQLESGYNLSVNSISNLINGTFNSNSDANLLAIIFTPVDFNAKKGLMLPDEKAYQAYEKLIEIAEQSGLDIKMSQSFMPRRDYENCEKLSFKDYIASCGVTIKTEQEQRLSGTRTYFASSYDEETRSTGTYNIDDKTHALHEDYELVQYGDFVINTKESTLPIIRDTYYDTLFDDEVEDDNGENPNPDPANNNDDVDTEKTREKGVKFKVSDIRSNIRKGVAYNVVNQVQMGFIRPDYYKSSYDSSEYGLQMHDDYWYYENGSLKSSYEGEMSTHGWLGYTYTDHTGQTRVYKKGNIYYVGGEFLTQSNTVVLDGIHRQDGSDAEYDLEGHHYATYNYDEKAYGYSGYGMTGAKNIRGAAMRNTEYKWGELVFVSKPDKVEDLAFDRTKQTITWTKPVDEGYGVTGKNKTAQDDYIKINEYVVRVSDENGKELYNTTVERTAKNNVSFDLKNLVTKSGVYNISVTAKNPIGESEAVVYENAVVDLADIEVTMTPDQPVHISTDTVEFKETITNTGKLKLTNLIIYQTAMGEYVPMDGLTVKGTKASVAELDVGQSIDILYRVPASNAKNGVLTNTVEVTTNDQKLTDTASATVIVNEYNPLMTVTAVSDKRIYTDDDTVVISTTVENKGTEVFNNVTVNNSIEGGTYTNTDSEAVTASEERGSIIIKTLNPGDKIDLTYEIPAKDIKAGKNGAVQSIVKADDGTVTAGTMAEFRVIRPDVTIKAIPTKTEYKNDEDVTYTLFLKNTGNITLTDVTVSAGIRGTFDEIEQGEINSKGDMVIKELAAGKSVSLTYTVSSDNTTFGTMNNLFGVTANENASAEADTEIRIAFYGIDVMKTVEEKTYVVGDKVAFHTKVTNTGDGELKNIYITEDTAGTFKLADGAVIYTDDTIVIESLKAGESYTYDYYVDATEDNITDGMVGGTSSVRVNDELIGSDTASTRVYTQSLTFKKTVDSDKEYRRGDKVVWTDTVTNTGECNLTNIVITESLVGEFKTDYETTADSVTIPKLAQGESVSVEFTSTITSADVTDRTYTCTAEVVAREYLSASDSASVKIVGPAVTVGKYADKNYYAKGERVVFTEVITNSGDLTLTNVKVVENFDGKYTQYDKSFTVDGRTLTIPEIAVGDSVVFHFAVDRSLIDSDTIESTITVTCDQDVSNSATVVVKVDNSSDPDTASDTNTDTDTSNTDSGKDNTDTSNDNTDTTNTDSGKDNTDKSNTDSGKDNTDTSNTDSGKDNTDTTNTDSGKDNTDTTNTDSGKDNTDTSNTDSGKDNTDTSNTDSGKDNTDTSNTDSGKDNTDSSNTDSGKDNTDTSIQPDTDTTGKESDDKPTKKHLMGDVNMDGKVTGKDAMIIQRYAINMVKLDPVQLFLADVTNDKKVTAADALNIMRYTIKMHTSSRTGEQVDIPSELLPKEQ